MNITNKKYVKNRSLIQIVLGNKKKWVGEIIFLNNVKKTYFILPFYNLYAFKLKIVFKSFENTFVYNENDLLFDQNLELEIEKKVSFINSINYIKQKNNYLSCQYRKLNILKNLKHSIVTPFSNVLFIKDNINYLSNLYNYNLKINNLKKSGFTKVEIKKIFVK